MRIRLSFVVCAALALLAALPAAASHLVTGNGYGFAVVSPDSGAITRFYAHPYSFAQPNPNNPLSEGIETTNFLKQITCGPLTPQNPSTDYDSDSHIIRIHNPAGEERVFMPFGLEQAALILTWSASSASARQDGCRVEWAHPVRSTTVIRKAAVEIRLLQFDGAPESLLLIPLEAQQGPRSSHGQDLSGSSSWAILSLEPGSEIDAAIGAFQSWCSGLAPSDLVRRELAQLEHWRASPTVHFESDKEHHLWRQSEVMLRIAQSREPNRPGRNGNGLIVACLPDGVYFTPWVRDMAYALMAFIRMGHQAEARAGLLAYFNAQPTGKMRAQTADADYQVSVVRYFGNGAEEPFFTQEGAINIEFDDWGLALWVLGEYARTFNDAAILNTATFRGPLYPSARDYIMKPLLKNLESYGSGQIVAADTSIWEEHQKDKKHFAWSTALAIMGLREFADIAHRAGDEPSRTEALDHAARLQSGFNTAFIRDGHLHGTLEPGIKNDIDGALLAIINFGIVTDPALMRDTVARMQLLRVASGGYRRVRGTYTDPAIFEYWYEQEEFLFVDFSLSEVDRRLGNLAQSKAILDRIVDKSAADHNIVPEMYVAVPCQLFSGSVGDPTGALPMVGYGAGEFILELEAREQLLTKP